MDWTTRKGHLDRERTEGVTFNECNGHLNVDRWLHENIDISVHRARMFGYADIAVLILFELT